MQQSHYNADLQCSYASGRRQATKEMSVTANNTNVQGLKYPQKVKRHVLTCLMNLAIMLFIRHWSGLTKNN